MSFPDFIEWCFLGVISGGVVVLWQVKETISGLNTRIEILIEKHEHHRDTIEDHELRLRMVEGFERNKKSSSGF